MSAEVNRAIVEAFENNVISSTTLMANMPGFDELVNSRTGIDWMKLEWGEKLLICNGPVV